MPRCRCHSRKLEKRCCAPFHSGRPAPTPEALMRSRYAAYAKGLVDYIIETTDPEGPQWQDDREAWSKETNTFCDRTRFEGLVILEAPESVNDRGTVTFRAILSRNGQDTSFVETSAFRRIDGRWCYIDAVRT